MQGLHPSQKLLKRAFDVVFASLGLVLVWPLIVIAWLLSTIETRSNGFYLHTRVGLHGELFGIVKIRTMWPEAILSTDVTTTNDPRITSLGRLFRKTKIDELPQLFNVLIGNMSFVGPRPDVPGFADQLTGDDRIVLSVRPGITGPATLAFRDEEQLLAQQPDPERYNREVLYPQKVELNKAYIAQWSLCGDIGFIFRTIFSQSAG